MRIAVPTNDGTTIADHFGRSAAFLVFEIEDGQIRGRELRANTAQHTHEAGSCGHAAGEEGKHNHAGILAALEGCQTVLCGGMGWRAAEALKAAGVTPVTTVAAGPVDDAVAAYLKGELAAGSGEFCRCGH